jgi:hypothetical protein
MMLEKNSDVIAGVIEGWLKTLPARLAEDAAGQTGKPLGAALKTARVRGLWLFNRALLPARRSGAELRFAVELLYRRGGEPQVGSEVRLTRILRLSRPTPQFMNDVDGECLSRFFRPQFIKLGISVFCRAKTPPILYPGVDFNNDDEQ